MSKQHHRWLLELTSLPTAAAREDRVIAWIERWVARRRLCALARDRYGNLLITQRGTSSRSKRAPILFTAHMDHPAFVVREVLDPRNIAADFRGGVGDAYFVGTRVRLWRTDGSSVRGRIETCDPPPEGEEDKRVRVRLTKSLKDTTDVRPGDILTWDLPSARIARGLLHAPACDDLAGVAAALAAFDDLLKRKAARHVAVLLTRCEEVGFIGAIGACTTGIIAKHARVIALENSRSFAESPIGGGPIVRVGDRTSTFDPDLTYRVGQVAQRLAQRDSTFKWQRKLMPGGTCEATAYQTYGYASTCICLPLGNYHNMDETRTRIAPEFISVADFDHLVRLLVAVGESLDDDDTSIRPRLDKLFASRRALLTS